MSNHLKLLDALLRQPSYLLENLLHRPTRVPTRDERNSAIGAEAVASFGNLDIGVMPWRSDGALLQATRFYGMPEVGNQVHERELAVILVHFGQLFLQFCHITLTQATHHEEFLQFLSFFSLRKLQDRVDGFFFGVTNKPAGVDDGNLALWLLGVVHTMIACCLQLAHQPLCIH